MELIENDFSKLVGADKQKILDAYQQYVSMVFNKHIYLYGGGKASENIRLTLESLN